MARGSDQGGPVIKPKRPNPPQETPEGPLPGPIIWDSEGDTNPDVHVGARAENHAHALPAGKKWLGSGEGKLYWAPWRIQIKDNRSVEGGEPLAVQKHEVELINETDYRVDISSFSVSVKDLRKGNPLFNESFGKAGTLSVHPHNDQKWVDSGESLLVNIIWAPRELNQRLQEAMAKAKKDNPDHYKKVKELGMSDQEKKDTLLVVANTVNYPEKPTLEVEVTVDIKGY